MSATAVIGSEAQDVHGSLKDMTGGRGPDACIDAVKTDQTHAHR